MNPARVILVLLACLLAQPAAWSASTVDVFEFDSDEQRARYRVLIEELRCPKCLNTNIAGSDAPIAQDLRALVYRMIVDEGKTDQQILDFLHARYGDFVLYDPPFTPRTWLLWLLPVLVAGIGVAVLLRIQRSARRVGQAQLAPEERARLEDIMKSN